MRIPEYKNTQDNTGEYKNAGEQRRIQENEVYEAARTYLWRG